MQLLLSTLIIFMHLLTCSGEKSKSYDCIDFMTVVGHCYFTRLLILWSKSLVISEMFMEWIPRLYILVCWGKTEYKSFLKLLHILCWQFIMTDYKLQHTFSFLLLENLDSKTVLPNILTIRSYSYLELSCLLL